MQRKTILWISISAFFVLLFIALCIPQLAVIVEFAYHFLAGWALFLGRTLSGIHWNWLELGFAAGCVFILAIGLHWFIRSTRFRYSDRRIGPAPGQWSFKKTLSLVCLLLLLFVAGTAMVGIVHQSVWLATSKQPILRNTWEGFYERIASQNNLQQLSIASHNFDSEKSGFPVGTLFGEGGELLHGWAVQLLPYLNQQALYNRIDFQHAWNRGLNKPVFETRLKEFQSIRNRMTGNEDAYPPTDYATNVRVIGPRQRMQVSDIKGGTSNTILMGTVGHFPKPWGHPTNWRDPADGIGNSPKQFGSLSKSRITGSVSFAFCDGSVHAISDKIDLQVLRQLSTPEDDGIPNRQDW